MGTLGQRGYGKTAPCKAEGDVHTGSSLDNGYCLTTNAAGPPRRTASLAWGMLFEGMCCVRSVVVLSRPSCEVAVWLLPFAATFSVLLSSNCLGISWSRHLASYSPLSFVNTGSRCFCKVWNVETHLQEQIFGRAILIKAILLQTKEHFLPYFLFVVVVCLSRHNGKGRTAETQDYSLMCVL